jgi:hypothetical protein
MAKRRKVRPAKSQKLFRKGTKTNRKNVNPRPMRGGTRL